MQPPIEHMFGPHQNGVQYAGISLYDLLVELHANWSLASREELTGSLRSLLNTPQLTTFRYLEEATLDEDARRRISRLGVYLPFLKDVDEHLTQAQIEGLRLSLPFHSTYKYEGHELSLTKAQHDFPQWAAIAALYELLLRSTYWQERGETTVGMPYSPSWLALLHHGRINRGLAIVQFKAFSKELEVAGKSKFAFHPLDVMARLFDPDYFENLLEAELASLTPCDVTYQHLIH